MILKETYTLSNGVSIPKLGLGTWMIPNDETAQVVQEAIALGYRHIDTARAYGNESGVGDGLRACGVPREQIFLTTKLAAEIKTYEEAVRAIDRSLTTLGLDTIDLMIIHSPQPWRQFGACGPGPARVRGRRREARAQAARNLDDCATGCRGCAGGPRQLAADGCRRRAGGTIPAARGAGVFAWRGEPRRVPAGARERHRHHP